MISLIVYSPDRKERLMFEEYIHILAAETGDEKWNMQIFETWTDMKRYLAEEPLIDMICFDITGEEGIHQLEAVRNQYKHAFLLITADIHVSPMEYLRPCIAPVSLLLRPFGRDQARQILKEFFQEYMEQFKTEDIAGSFMIDTRDGRQYIPFQQIYYLEAREKKIFVRTRNQELGFYETIEKLMERLPEVFLRCHRSYIVNRIKIQKVLLSRNQISLRDNLTVPLSRSYKQLFKEYKI